MSTAATALELASIRSTSQNPFSKLQQFAESLSGEEQHYLLELLLAKN
jgi:hypothetical protein